MADYIPKSDRQMEAFLAAAVIVLDVEAPNAQGIIVKYGVPKADIDDVQARLATFTTALNAADVAKAAQQNAVTTKDLRRSELEEKFRNLVQRIQVAPGVTDAAKSEAHLPLRDDTRSFSAPVAPTALVATPNASGFNDLAWDGSTNAAGIRFVIEAKIGAATEFSTVDVVTASKFRHAERTPGQPIVYRVRARRGEVVSAPSNTASVYS
jgi:hypothetical protein